MKIDDVLEAMPALLEREPDASKRQELSEMTARLEEVKHRKLLCDVHGIQVFEYRGKRSLVLSDEMANQMQNLERQTSDSLREMVEDLMSLSIAANFKAGAISPPPQPLYTEDGLVNGEAFQKAAASIWARTAIHRGLWEQLRGRLGAKLSRLRSSVGKARLECANSLKREFADAIDVIVDANSRKAHGSAVLIDWKMTNGTSRSVTLPWAALKLTCALIVLNLTPPTKGEVQKVIEAKWPNLRLTRSGWTKVWRTAGLDWLGRKGKW